MRRTYDLVLLGDYRLFGGTTTSAADEIRTLSGAGYKVAIAQVDSHITGQSRPPLPEIQTLIDRGAADRLDAGERAHARLLVVHNARIMERPVAGLPEISSDSRAIVVHRAPLDGHGNAIFNAHAVHAIAEHSFGSGFVWKPISPICRLNMLGAGFDLPLDADDWPNIVFVDAWSNTRHGPRSARPIIGRHSRGELEKYPDSRDDVLRVYPDDAGLDIRMLGVDARLMKLMGRLPDNWTTWGFNAITPAALLEQIDHYVYFHHSRWFETFGRNVAEALASGAVVYLPRYLEQTFGDAALYGAPEEIVPAVRAMNADPAAYRAQSEKGRALIDAMYGPTRFLELVSRRVGPPQRACRRGVGFAPDDGTQPAGAPAGAAEGRDHADDSPKAEASALMPAPFVDSDVVVIADFSAADETAWRIANELRIQADARLKTVLVHLGGQDGGGRDVAVGRHVNPMIDACVRDGLATPVDPSATLIKTKLVIVHDPIVVFSGVPCAMPRILTEATVAVIDREPVGDAGKASLALSRQLIERMIGGKVVWAATSEPLRQALTTDGKLSLMEGTWDVSIHPDGCTPGDTIRRPAPRIGRLVGAGGEEWPADPAEAIRPFPKNGRAVIKLLRQDDTALPFDAGTLGYQVIGSNEISPLKFLTGLDMVAHYSGEAAKLPLHALAWAMTKGVLVLAPACLRPILGDGPVYVEADEAAARALDLWADQEQLAARRDAAIVAARRRFGAVLHLGRLQRLMGPIRPSGATRAAPLATRKRALFMTSNGTGLGHVTRLLSVARRLPAEKVEAVFVSLSQAIEPIQRAGFAVEYVPSPIYADVDGKIWNQWFAQRMRQIVEHYRPEVVVFDGSSTYEGLNQAIGPDSGIRLVWIRRGMWRAQQDNTAIIERQKYYDLIVEPGDIADSRDAGETARWRHSSIGVDPIRMFDEKDLLPHHEACRRLGLDPGRPACLIQLGSGANRDIVSMIDDALAACAKHPSLQPVIAEGLISSRPVDFWPGVKRLRGYPMSPYFNAFDFTVSAAGYNSFNEIMSFGLPAIFVANQNPTMDDQDGRSRFAQEMGAAFHLDETETGKIGLMVDTLMHERARDVLRTNMRRIARPNGAQPTADLIHRLLAI